MTMDGSGTSLLACLVHVLALSASILASKVYDDNERGVPQTFWGHFQGKCQDNGFYYSDRDHFIFCFHGNSYIMPCAPGTQNSAYASYANDIGKKKSDLEFCNVNLVATGYEDREIPRYGRRIEGDYKAGQSQYAYASNRVGYNYDLRYPSISRGPRIETGLYTGFSRNIEAKNLDSEFYEEVLDMPPQNELPDRPSSSKGNIQQLQPHKTGRYEGDTEGSEEEFKKQSSVSVFEMMENKNKIGGTQEEVPATLAKKRKQGYRRRIRKIRKHAQQDKDTREEQNEIKTPLNYEDPDGKKTIYEEDYALEDNEIEDALIYRPGLTFNNDLLKSPYLPRQKIRHMKLRPRGFHQGRMEIEAQ